MAIWPKGAFKTPLGNVPVDEELSLKLMELNPNVRNIPEAFAREHSLEVQLPFLQKVLSNFPATKSGGLDNHYGWKIVPLVMGSIDNDSSDTYPSLAVRENW